MFDVRCPVGRFAALVRGCGRVSCARADPSRASCTWEKGSRVGRGPFFLEIPRFLGVRQGRLTGSHVRTGGSAHMGGTHRRSPKPVFRMIPRFCPERVANERLTSLDPAPGRAVGRPSAPPASGARMLRARGATLGVPGAGSLPRACREAGTAGRAGVTAPVATLGVPGDRRR